VLLEGLDNEAISLAVDEARSASASEDVDLIRYEGRYDRAIDLIEVGPSDGRGADDTQRDRC
jgi:hypothetical protein